MHDEQFYNLHPSSNITSFQIQEKDVGGAEGRGLGLRALKWIRMREREGLAVVNANIELSRTLLLGLREEAVLLLSEH